MTADREHDDATIAFFGSCALAQLRNANKILKPMQLYLKENGLWDALYYGEIIGLVHPNRHSLPRRSPLATRQLAIPPPATFCLPISDLPPLRCTTLQDVILGAVGRFRGPVSHPGHLERRHFCFRVHLGRSDQLRIPVLDALHRRLF